MPTYQPGIPTGLVPLQIDYQNLQDNFQQLNIAYGVDHVPFSDTSGNPPGGISGMHNIIHLTSQVAPLAIAGVGQFFNTSVNDGISTDTTLYYLTGGNKTIQLTRNFQPVAASNGYTFLPGGIIFQWGKITNPTVGDNAVLFASSNIDFPNACFSVQISLERTSANVDTAVIKYVSAPPASSITKTGFTAIAPTNGSNAIYWLAIGN